MNSKKNQQDNYITLKLKLAEFIDQKKKKKKQEKYKIFSYWIHYKGFIRIKPWLYVCT